MKYVKLTVLLAFTSLLLIGCTTTIPMTGNIADYNYPSDFLDIQISYSVDSLPGEGEKFRALETGNPYYIHESLFLERILQSYLSKRFNLGAGENYIKVKVQEISISESDVTSTGKDFLNVVVGGASLTNLTAEVAAYVEIKMLSDFCL